jgi:hypothetical protein
MNTSYFLTLTFEQPREELYCGAFLTFQKYRIATQICYSEDTNSLNALDLKENVKKKINK